ncbi:MAG: acylphosphatase [Methylococcales bacterium]|nr:acylphosphatase [Methylococcales bacterium]
MKTIHIVISGRVQGVYFRAFTKKQAIKHNITGTVLNTERGTVEIIAQAEQENLVHFVKWCHKGPLLAKVDNISITEYSTTEKFFFFKIC